MTNTQEKPVTNNPSRILPRAFPKGEQRGEAPKPTQPKGTHLSVIGVDHEVRLALIEHKAKNGLRNKDLMGPLKASNVTLISKYLNARGDKTPDGNWQAIQTNARDYLALQAVRPTPKAATADKSGAEELWQTAITEQVFGVLNFIRETNDFALLTGDAGIGKTSSLALYARANPSATLITAHQQRRDARQIVAALMAAAKLTQNGRASYADMIERSYENSDRIVIIDNAQRLSIGALAYLFDFHDATGCAVALVGNVEVLAKIRGNEQFFSRIGRNHEVKFGNAGEAETFAVEMVRRIDPSLAETLGAAAAERMLGKGHARTLHKQLKMTRALLRAKEFEGKAEKAFAAARTMLVKEGGAN